MRISRCAFRATWLLIIGAVAAACDVSVKDGNFSFGVISGRAADDLHRTYALPADGELEIDNRNGSIDVQASETAANVDVTISRQARARGDEAAQALLKQIEIREEAGPERVKLQTVAPRDGSIEVHYAVRAPPTVALVLKVENGRMTLRGMAGRVRATASNGSINGVELAGAIQASTVNGPVQVELSAVGGEVSLATVNGPVRLTIPTTAKADFSARVVNGRISTTGLTFENLDQPSGREMKARLNGGGPGIRLETTNGPIVITGK